MYSFARMLYIVLYFHLEIFLLNSFFFVPYIFIFELMYVTSLFNSLYDGVDLELIIVSLYTIFCIKVSNLN